MPVRPFRGELDRGVVARAACASACIACRVIIGIGVAAAVRSTTAPAAVLRTESDGRGLCRVSGVSGVGPCRGGAGDNGRPVVEQLGGRREHALFLLLFRLLLLLPLAAGSPIGSRRNWWFRSPLELHR